MDRDQFERFYWNYYLLLENKFLATTSFVYLSEDNFETYSFEYVHLLLSICSALENTMKAFPCYPTKFWDATKSFLDENFKKSKPVVSVKEHPEMSLRPFLPTDDNGRLKLLWWDAYNNIKHDWVANFTSANMGCAINALAALFTVGMIFIKNASFTSLPDIPLKGSALFFLKDVPCKTAILTNSMPESPIFLEIKN